MSWKLTMFDLSCNLNSFYPTNYWEVLKINHLNALVLILLNISNFFDQLFPCSQQRIHGRSVVRLGIQRAAVIPRPPHRPPRRRQRQPAHHHAHRPQIRWQHHRSFTQTRTRERPWRTSRHNSSHRFAACHCNRIGVNRP